MIALKNIVFKSSTSKHTCCFSQQAHIESKETSRKQTEFRNAIGCLPKKAKLWSVTLLNKLRTKKKN